MSLDSHKKSICTSVVLTGSVYVLRICSHVPVFTMHVHLCHAPVEMSNMIDPTLVLARY